MGQCSKVFAGCFLPYLEEGAVHNIAQSEELGKNVITLYNCPSRRGATIGPVGVSLVDYAASTAGPSRSEPNTTYHPAKNFDAYLNETRALGVIDNATMGVLFWGCASCSEGHPGEPLVSALAGGGRPVRFRGVIQRTDWQPAAALPGGGARAGYGVKMTFEKITDGSSKTMVIGEKWVPSEFYDGASDPRRAGDDLGWADGWDCNNMRSAMFTLRPDSDVTALPPLEGFNQGACNEQHDFPFGSAHSGGINVMFGDGSVGFVSYEIDQENLNRMAHRQDGETMTYGL
jgi:prepilin-type processing-associated H-X9-DG protein